MNFKLYSYLIGLFLFLFPFFTYAADNVDYAARVDCDSWNDTTATIVAWTSASNSFLTLKKATEEMAKLNNQHTNSRFWIKIKDWCSFATDSTTRINVPLNSYGWYKWNSFFMQPESTNWLFLVDVWEVWFLEIRTMWNLFQIKNAIFQNWKNWMIISQDWNSEGWLVITDSKFDIINQIMWNPRWDPSNWNFEVKNSLIEINKKYWRSIIRFPSYFHDNIVNYRSLKDWNWNNIGTDWLFWGHANTMKSNKNMWIINNKINIFLDMRKNNFNWIVNQNTRFIVWLNRTDNKKFLFMNNEVNFSWPWTSYLHLFRGFFEQNVSNTVLFINNKFNWLWEINHMSWCSNWYSETIYFLNNTFDTSVVVNNYGWETERSCYAQSYSVWFNNLNAFAPTANLWRNFTTWTTEKGLRFAVDLNYDWNIESSEILSNSYCSPKPSCQNSNAPLMIIY